MIGNFLQKKALQKYSDFLFGPEIRIWYNWVILGHGVIKLPKPLWHANPLKTSKKNDRTEEYVSNYGNSY